MTYTLYAGEILPRDPPRPPRCEALMHFSAAQPSPRQQKSPRSPRSLPAMDPSTIRSPRRVGAPVSGRPWSPGAVDAQGQWNPVVTEEVSPARLRAVPTSRAEAAALHDELLERLSAEPRLSYADQMRLVDFGMAEAARQARSTCAERGAALELLRAEYARLLAVMQGPARRGGAMESLRRELRREQARTTELAQQLEAARVREEVLNGQWMKRRAAAQLVAAGGRLSSAAHASGANPTSLSAADPALSPSAMLEGARQSGEQISESLAELYPRLSTAYPVLTSKALPSPPRQSGAVAEIRSGAAEVTSGGAAAEEVTPGEIAEAVGEIAEEMAAQIAELDPDAQLAVVLQACARLGPHHRDIVGSVLLASRSEG